MNKPIGHKFLRPDSSESWRCYGSLRTNHYKLVTFCFLVVRWTSWAQCNQNASHLSHLDWGWIHRQVKPSLVISSHTKSIGAFWKSCQLCSNIYPTTMSPSHLLPYHLNSVWPGRPWRYYSFIKDRSPPQSQTHDWIVVGSFSLDGQVVAWTNETEK